MYGNFFTPGIAPCVKDKTAPEVLFSAACLQVQMPQVQASRKWEKNFRTHGDLFRSQTITKPVSFGTIESNHVAICVEPNDLAVCMKLMNSPATAEAMAFDDVLRDTVKIFVLDKEFKVQREADTPEA